MLVTWSSTEVTSFLSFLKEGVLFSISSKLDLEMAEVEPKGPLGAEGMVGVTEPPKGAEGDATAAVPSTAFGPPLSNFVAICFH